MDHWGDAAKEVAVSTWLAGSGVAAARTWGVPQPIEVHEHPVTFWWHIDGRRGGRRDVRQLGQVLRKVHELEPPAEFDLPINDPLNRVGSRIERARIPFEEKEFLRGLVGDLRESLGGITFPLPRSVTHGDAHVQNLMVVDEEPILIDFERVAYGQPEWDLAVTATEFVTAQFWSETEYSAFVESYGFDVITWDGFSILRQAQELKMTTWLMQNVDESPQIRDEFNNRIIAIREGRPCAPWRAF
jgi:fructosamine-3-kinase